MMHHDSGAGELRAKARQAATVMELTNMHQYVAHTDVMVSKLHVGVKKQEQVMEKRFDALEAKIARGERRHRLGRTAERFSAGQRGMVKWMKVKQFIRG